MDVFSVHGAFVLPDRARGAKNAAPNAFSCPPKGLQACFDKGDWKCYTKWRLAYLAARAWFLIIEQPQSVKKKARGLAAHGEKTMKDGKQMKLTADGICMAFDWQ